MVSGLPKQVVSASIIPKSKNDELKYSQRQNDYPQTERRLVLVIPNPLMSGDSG
jgi:hypothetical protein